MTDFEKAISIIKAAEETKSSEFKNRLASALKTEYIDFQTINNDTEMTIELGECLRDQLNTIFKLLKKNGINMEG